MPSPYATNEDHSMLWLEQAVHASTHIGAVAFGIHMTIYALVTYSGLRHNKTSWRWFIFNTLLFLFGTVNLATSIHFNETAWIDERNYPGGPYAFLVEQQNRPVQTVGNAAFLITSTMAEGLLLYRVYVIWNQWYIKIIPTLFFLACLALHIAVVIQISLPFSSTWTSLSSLGFPVWMMLMVLNLLLTFLLVIRLLYLRRQLETSIGTHYGKTYLGVATMVVESALPFGILSMIFLVLFGKQDPAQNLFLPLLVQVECITPMLIILRVIRGRAWSANTLSDPASVAEFAAGTRSSASEAFGTNVVDMVMQRPKVENESSGSSHSTV